MWVKTNGDVENKIKNKSGVMKILLIFIIIFRHIKSEINQPW